ncbi:hypothetical protein PR048_019888 [Dryococelus australis]|uniref:Uncharacterized protein n=1 Tax=Dryococelus australis TaxID=614101 RepID=A0ABQ9H4S8_9NEOP|nr:hypothetical protein PR048_019888 [Dryococelus australis]
MRMKRGEYRGAPKCKGRGNGKSPRKPAEQRHCPARFPHAKIQERPRRESNPVRLVEFDLPPSAETANLGHDMDTVFILPIRDNRKCSEPKSKESYVKLYNFITEVSGVTSTSTDILRTAAAVGSAHAMRRPSRTFARLAPLSRGPTALHVLIAADESWVCLVRKIVVNKQPVSHDRNAMKEVGQTGNAIAAQLTRPTFQNVTLESEVTETKPKRKVDLRSNVLERPSQSAKPGELPVIPARREKCRLVLGPVAPSWFETRSETVSKIDTEDCCTIRVQSWTGDRD